MPDDPPDDEPLPELLPLEPGLVELPEPLGLLGLELGEEGLLDEEPDPLEPDEPALSRWQAATLKPTAVARINAVQVDCLRMLTLLI
jgi:hypothetical protein